MPCLIMYSSTSVVFSKQVRVDRKECAVSEVACEYL